MLTVGDTPASTEFSLGTLTPASSVTFAHVLPLHQAPVPGLPGFSDAWVFEVGAPAATDSWIASFGLGAGLGIGDLRLRLVEWTPGGGGAVLQDWSLATPIVVNGQTLQTATLGAYAPLLVGTPYALQVQGTVFGLDGGAYSGGLNVIASPVPLPAALPIFLAALGLLGLTVRRRC